MVEPKRLPRALVIYESMYGNTRAVAEAITTGLETLTDARVRSVHDVRPDEVAACDLIVVGAPTHTWGLSRAATRQAAADTAQRSDGLTMVPGWDAAPAMRDWLADLAAPASTRAAAFDTRMHAPLFLSGSAARKIDRALKRSGLTVCARPKGFIVTRDNELFPGELERARVWGRHLAGLACAAMDLRVTG